MGKKIAMAIHKSSCLKIFEKKYLMAILIDFAGREKNCHTALVFEPEVRCKHPTSGSKKVWLFLR